MPEVEQISIIRDTSYVDFVVKALRSCGAKATVVSAPADKTDHWISLPEFNSGITEK